MNAQTIVYVVRDNKIEAVELQSLHEFQNALERADVRRTAEGWQVFYRRDNLSRYPWQERINNSYDVPAVRETEAEAESFRAQLIMNWLGFYETEEEAQASIEEK